MIFLFYRESNELRLSVALRGAPPRHGGRRDVPVPAGRGPGRGGGARASPHPRAPQGPRCQVRAR